MPGSMTSSNQEIERFGLREIESFFAGMGERNGILLGFKPLLQSSAPAFVRLRMTRIRTAFPSHFICEPASRVLKNF